MLNLYLTDKEFEVLESVLGVAYYADSGEGATVINGILQQMKLERALKLNLEKSK